MKSINNKFTYTILLVLYFSAFFILADEGGRTGKKAVFGEEYLKIELNKEFIFDSDFGETVSRIVLLDNGYQLINENEDFRYCQTLIQNENGLFLKSTDQEVDVFLFLSSSVAIEYPEPILQLPLPLIEGYKWKWEGYQFQDGDSVDVSIDGHIVGEETISVPAGEFNALRVDFYIETSAGEKSDVSQWLVPGLGRIKLFAQIEDTGLIGLALDIFGFDEIQFELKEVREIRQ